MTTTMNTDQKFADYYTMVNYATKAPSGHNTQPWIFNFANNAIEIHPDYTKELPIVDKEHRELYISLGCAAENLIIAARQLEYRVEYSVREASDNHLYIHLELQPGEAEKDYLFDQINKRQTNRRVYCGWSVPRQIMEVVKILTLDPLVKVHYYEKNSTGFSILKQFIQMGNNAQMSNDHFREELLSWIRFNKSQKNKMSDGVTYEVMGVPSTPAILGKHIIKSFLKPKAQNKSDMQKMDSSSHLVLFTIPENSAENWIVLGRRHQRFLLEASRLGIACSYMNQPCEEVGIAARLPSALNIGGELPALLVRIGYAEQLPYSPRRKVKEVVRIREVRSESDFLPHEYCR